MGIFRSKKKAEAKAAEEAKKAQALFETGLSGTVNEFAQAYGLVTEESIMVSPKEGKCFDNDKEQREHLQRGALQAFHEDHPENVQTMLSLIPDSTLADHSGAPYDFHDVVNETLLSVAQDSKDPAAAIELALVNVSEEKKQHMLDGALFHAVCQSSEQEKQDRIMALLYTDRDEPVSDSISANESFIEALLKSGANANAKKMQGRFKENVLGVAILSRQSFSVIKLLHDNGASVDDAVEYLKDLNGLYSGSYMEQLRIYEAKIASVADKEMIVQLKQNISDLTRDKRDLETKVRHLEAQSKPRLPSP